MTGGISCWSSQTWTALTQMTTRMMTVSVDGSLPSCLWHIGPTCHKHACVCFHKHSRAWCVSTHNVMRRPARTHTHTHSRICQGYQHAHARTRTHTHTTAYAKDTNTHMHMHNMLMRPAHSHVGKAFLLPFSEICFSRNSGAWERGRSIGQERKILDRGNG